MYTNVELLVVHLKLYSIKKKEYIFHEVFQAVLTQKILNSKIMRNNTFIYLI